MRNRAWRRHQRRRILARRMRDFFRADQWRYRIPEEREIKKTINTPCAGFPKGWPGVGVGRYWKRQLSKARRRAWRDPHERGLAGVEGEVNWRTW